MTLIDFPPAAPRMLSYRYHDTRPTTSNRLAEWALEQQLYTAPDYDQNVTDVLTRFHTGIDVVQRAWIVSRIEILLDLADEVHRAELHDRRWVWEGAIDDYCSELANVARLLRSAPTSLPCDADVA